MFSGIVETMGKVARVTPQGGDLRLSLSADGEFICELKQGDSVMANGVCLTVTELENNSFTAQVSAETLACTTLAGWDEGERVNLERALCLGDRIDGHLVSGHVDAVARVHERRSDASSERFEIETPASLAALIAVKGSICVDGVSLTINTASDTMFGVNIIPYTLENTTFSLRRRGDVVNLEADLIARYVERCLAHNG